MNFRLQVSCERMVERSERDDVAILACCVGEIGRGERRNGDGEHLVISRESASTQYFFSLNS